MEFLGEVRLGCLMYVGYVMHLGRGNGQHRYVLDGQQIQRVSEQKDLGVLIADNLKPSAHCVTVYISRLAEYWQ